MSPGEHRSDEDDDRWGSNSDGPGMEDARPLTGPEQLQTRSGDSRESSVSSDDGAQQNSGGGNPNQRKKRKTQQYQKTS